MSSKGDVFFTFQIFLTVTMCVNCVVHAYLLSNLGNEYLSSDVPIRKETVFMRRVENKTADVSVVQRLRSHGYPETCCQSYVYAVFSDDLLPVDCIHLYFEDLDLPLNASLLVLEVVKNTSSVLFQYTSGTQDNVFLCNSIKACRPNSSLLVILKHQGNATLPFAGFSARLWSTGLESSSTSSSGVQTYASASSVPCQVVATLRSGQEIVQTVVSSDKILDYVWVVKNSDKECHSCEFAFAVLMLATEFEGELEVRQGIHSEAFLVVQKSLKASNESYFRLSLEAEFGLHIRLRVWPNITGADVAFVSARWEPSESAIEREDTGSISFLRWLLPLVGSFVLIGVTFFVIKTYMKSKYRHHHNQCNNMDMIQPVHAVRLPLLHLPNQVPGGSQPERSSVIFIPSRPHRQISFGESVGSHSSSFPHATSIPIPMTRSTPIAIPVVVRPQVHRDGQVFPPSYEEVTAEHSCGNSSDGLDDLEHLPEYHPPSYEDASQGKVDVVSSWLSSTERPVSD